MTHFSRHARGKNKGFTLIELLVVISIIGLLSSILFAYIRTARERAIKADMVADLLTIRTQAALYSTVNNGTYGFSDGVDTPGQACPTSGDTMFAQDKTIKAAVLAANKYADQSGTSPSVECYTNGSNSYAVIFRYQKGQNEYCVDTGNRVYNNQNMVVYSNQCAFVSSGAYYSAASNAFLDTVPTPPGGGGGGGDTPPGGGGGDTPPGDGGDGYGSGS